MNRAKKAQKDEFYMRVPDIENELNHYRHHFIINKVVFSNCDDPEYSHFWKYFSMNFEFLRIRKLIATHYETEKSSYKLEMYKDERGVHTDIKTLKGNGDFKSPECIELLKQSDIVVTNPPFSLFREYIAQLMEYDKKFVIIGSKNAITYKEFFPLLKENKVWIGYTNVHAFKTAIDGEEKVQKFGNIGWYTNLDIDKRYEDIILYKNYNSEEYPKYDNYEAIEVSKVAKMPCDYNGVMGVPITFMDKYNPEQFEVVGEANHGSDNEYDIFKPKINRKYVFKRV